MSALNRCGTSCPCLRRQVQLLAQAKSVRAGKGSRRRKCGGSLERLYACGTAAVPASTAGKAGSTALA